MPKLIPWRRGGAAVAERDAGPTGLSSINDPQSSMYQALVNISEGLGVNVGPYGTAGIAELPWVSLNTAPRVTAVYRAVQLTAGTLGGLPPKAYEDRDGTRVRLSASDDSTVALLTWEPNPEMDVPTFYKTSFAHNALGGNTYWYLVRNGLGQLTEIWPISPNRVRVGRDRLTQQKVYELDGELPMMDAAYPGGEIVHVPNLTLDGLVGLNPVAFARLSLQLARATEEYGARVFSNGALPLGILQTDASLDEETADRLARRWERYHRGLKNSHRIAIVDNGAKFQQTSIAPQDAQFLETRRFQIQEIARLFGLPPHLLADASSSTSWGSGLEEQTRSMVVFTFSDYTNRFEAALTRRVLARPGRYVRFDYRALLRGSTLQRYHAYNLAILSGWLSRNEVREYEDLDAVDGLDEYLVPTNMAASNAAGTGDGGGGDMMGGGGDMQAKMSELAAAIDSLASQIDGLQA